jgi:hypothetical protein
MANATVTVLEADGTTQTDVVVLGVGRQAAAASKSVALATEDQATLAALAVAQGSTTLGQSGTLIQAAATTAAPTYTNGQTSPLNMTTAGSLRTTTTIAAAAVASGAFASGSISSGAIASGAIASGAFASGSVASGAIVDGAMVTVGAKTDAKSTATDATSTSLMSVMKQVSASIQALAAIISSGKLLTTSTIDAAQLSTLGQNTAANSASVVPASDYEALSVFLSLDLDETEEDVKTSAGTLHKLRITNRATTVRYVKVYNATAANVTVGTTTPIDTITVPAAGSADLPTVLTENYGGYGLKFSTALSLAATTGFAHADTGAPGANDIIISAYYK